MPNIFDGIAKLSDVDLKNQIAMLEEVTVGNALSQMGNEVSNRTMSLFGSIRKAINGKETKVPPVIKIEDRISNKYHLLDGLSRAELEERIRSVLVQKINAATMLGLEKPSDDRISVEIIELACKNYKKEINSKLTFAQKADIIRHRYDEKMLSQMQEKLSKQNEQEKRQTEAAIQKELDSMSGERQEELRKALNVEKLNGEIVRQIFASTAGVSATLLVMETAGFSAYIALTTVMHAVFTTLLGITLPFAAYTGATTFLSVLTGPVGLLVAGGVELIFLNRSKNKLIYELSAQIVWLSVSTYGHKFTPKEEELPSWLPSMERDKEIREIKALHEILKENEKMKETLLEQDKELEQANSIIRNNHEKINYLNREKEEVGKKLESQQKEKERLHTQLNKALEQLHNMDSNDSVPAEELEAAQAEVNKLVQEKEVKDKEIEDLYQLLQQDEDQIKKLTGANNDYQQTIEKCNGVIEHLETELEYSRQNAEKRADKNAKELERRWTKFFSKLEFSQTVFKEVVKNFEYNEFIEIEMKLREIDDAKDPGAVSGNRGKVGGKRYHVEFSTYAGFPSRIFYKATNGANNIKSAVITDIVKHNDPRYNELCR